MKYYTLNSRKLSENQFETLCQLIEGKKNAYGAYLLASDVVLGSDENLYYLNAWQTVNHDHELMTDNEEYEYLAPKTALDIFDDVMAQVSVKN